MSLYYVHYYMALQGAMNLVLAESLCALYVLCAGGVCMCVCVCVCLGKWAGSGELPRSQICCRW